MKPLCDGGYMLNRLFHSVQVKNEVLEFTGGNGYMNKVYSKILNFVIEFRQPN